MVELYPADYEEVTVGAAAVQLTASKASLCDAAVVAFEDGAIRYRLDRVAPTATYGLKLASNATLKLDRAEATGFRAIRDATATTDGILRVTYYRKA